MSDDWRVRIDDPSPELESRLVEELGNAEIGRGDVEMLLWFDTADEAWSAAETVARLIDAERLASSVGVEWWDHESQEWQSTAEDDSAGDEGWETEGGFDFDDRTEVVDAPDEVWEVVVKLESRGSARELAAQAAARGRAAKRRWRRVVFECAGQETAEKLASDLRMEVAPGTAIHARRAPGPVWFPGGTGGDAGGGHAHHGGHHGHGGEHGNGGGDGGGGGNGGGGGGGNGGGSG